jgi:hypothetical protein
MAPIPPLVVAALGVLGAALVVRHFAKHWGKVDVDQAENAAIEASKRESMPKLRRDPDTGVYRP